MSRSPTVPVPVEGPLQGRMVLEPPRVALGPCLGPVEVGASLSAGAVEMHVGAQVRAGGNPGRVVGRGSARHGRGRSMSGPAGAEVSDVTRSCRGTSSGPDGVGAAPCGSEPLFGAGSSRRQPDCRSAREHVGASAGLGWDRARHGRGRSMSGPARVEVSNVTRSCRGTSSGPDGVAATPFGSGPQFGAGSSWRQPGWRSGQDACQGPALCRWRCWWRSWSGQGPSRSGSVRVEVPLQGG